jgi:hypothetical protein
MEKEIRPVPIDLHQTTWPYQIAYEWARSPRLWSCSAAASGQAADGCPSR